MPDDQGIALSNNARSAAIEAAVHKYHEIAVRWATATTLENQAKKLMADADTIKEEVNRVFKVLRKMGEVFSFDVVQEMKKHQERQALLPNREPQPAPGPINELATNTDGGKPKTIKEHAIAAAEQAYPNAIRASALRQQLSELGMSVHDKTIGMTFYRLSRDGVLRRDGWDWFFVPANQRESAISREEESPGDEPGLELHAAE